MHAPAALPVDLKDSQPWLHAKPEVVKQWQDDRFGMFVCWGPVSRTGLEIGWSRGKAWPHQKQGGQGPTPAKVYDDLYKQWKPDRFDARAWVRLAKDAGMKYMIFLVKHHDGFCLYDSKLTDYKSTGPEAAWKHDVTKDIADACHEADLKLILYYSQPDWHHPDYRTQNHVRYIQYLHGQIRELLTNYGRIDGLWFDLGGTPQDWDSENLFKMARQLQPWLIINNRCGLPGDFDTPENAVGFFHDQRPWETCATLGKQWSWKPQDNLRSFEECIRILVTCAAGNGNFALNTGPMPNGEIEPRQAERFREIGRWLAKYGESIRGTRGGPFRAQDERLRPAMAYDGNFAIAGGRWWGGSTHKENVIYLHILRWPSESLVLPVIDRMVISYSVLTGGKASVTQTKQGIEVRVATEHRDPLDTIIKLVLDGPAVGLKPVMPASGSLAFGKKATASNVFRTQPEFSPAKALDDDPNSRWGCDWGTHAAWLAVDLGEPKTFDRGCISEPFGRVRRFQLEVKDKESSPWRVVYTGTTIGENLTVKFMPTTGRYARLNLLETTEGPSIWEFQLFREGEDRR